MKLIERDNFLETLQSRFNKISAAEGHCFFITGEAGIGKTSLIKAFLKQVGEDSMQFVGACDSLFAPRPLAPLYDVAVQIKKNWADNIYSVSSVTELFTKFVEEFSDSALPVVLVFEDIHWADEGTLDFIKFFARRISRIRCLFILTSRDDVMNRKQPLRNLLSDLATDTFTRMKLTPLSKESVHKLAYQKGYNAENVYNISGGNPFYVNEILASYSPGIPDNIKDSILAVYNRQEEATKSAWQLLSVIPEGLELDRFLKIDVTLHLPIENCLETKILVVKNDRIQFKHELYRRTIENSLSPFKRVALHKNLLELFLTAFEETGEIERIVHHAKNASENKLVLQYAPIAAKQAASVGSHLEAAKLFFTAIEYYDKKDTEKLVKLFEEYAYECYLTNQVNDAIIYQAKALKIRKDKNELEEIGNGLSFLSKLWWYEGNRIKAESFAEQAIEVLNGESASRAKAMACSNMSKLKSEMDHLDECIFWGEKAVAIAEEVDDQETISDALLNMGSAIMMDDQLRNNGIKLLEQSLQIALKNSYHEHIARVYSTLGGNWVAIKNYDLAKKYLELGIDYCEEKQIDSLRLYMLSSKARLYLETGNWSEAYSIADNLLKKENLPLIIRIGALAVAATIKIRRGDTDGRALLIEAKNKAFETTELQRIIPVFLALLEYEWISGKSLIEEEVLAGKINTVVQLGKFSKESKFYFWLRKTGKNYLLPGEKMGAAMSPKEISFWNKKGSAYEHALILFEGDEDDKRKALAMMQQLDADAVCEKMKMQMRSSGIRKIPRGLRESTKGNPAQLTNRELDVLHLLKGAVQNKEIAETLFISPKTVDHHISSILFKLDVNSRTKAVEVGIRLGILKLNHCVH
ncbi:MAG: AAA family ATPase [Ginsengibacter sp.]